MQEVIRTELMIKYIKDTFEGMLAKKLNLVRVSAPLFVLASSGLNDHLSGTERVISFDASNMELEVVQSLAKWKRNALGRYEFSVNTGLYTDMNAIRRDEHLDNIHSIYVDQWDWEKVIAKEERTKETLFNTVKDIYSVVYKLGKNVEKKYGIVTNLPRSITFISSNDLLAKYPNLNAKERENAILREKKAVFIYQIGGKLTDGSIHDMRAADYDDWDLNGDILVYNEVLDMAFELSSMGIRVSKESLLKQLEEKNELYKLENPYCKDILEEKLPYTIGGGIGQSRLCLFFMKKQHIGEVQVSVWDDNNINEANQKNIYLL